MIRINHQIQAKELRLIDEEGANLGVFTLSEALQKAQESGTDLIEVSPNAQPPIAKLMSFDKYRYQEVKKLKKQKSLQKEQGNKQIRVGVKAALHDLQISADKINKFLEEKNVVDIQMTMRGREKANKDWAKQRLQEFMKLITVEHKVISDIKMGGYGLLVRIAPK
ncbi:MAG: translation initiation factor IF-3 [Candidatus Pacebacteria bacterium]|nr:translation initiation factor IF-3 [Candidatus Paceibacterota bacterium]